MLLRYLFKVHADRYSRAKDYKGWQQQKSKTTFSQENSLSDERRNTLQERKLQRKVNGQEDHLTRASTKSKRVKGLLQEWFGNTGTIGKDDKERGERPSGKK